MTTNGVGSNFGGFMGDRSRRPGAQNSASPQPNPSWADRVARQPAAMGSAARGLDHTSEILNLWGDKAYVWGSREALSEAVNKAARFVHPASAKTVANTNSFGTEAFGFGGRVITTAHTPLTYAELFHLGKKTIPFGQITWNSYKNTVRQNFSDLRTAVHPNRIRHFFAGVTPKRFLKETVYENNAQPIKNLFSKSADKQIGSGIFRIGAFAMMGLDTFKKARKTYLEAKAKENGSLADKLNTWKETGLTFLKYAFRFTLSWEIGGLAFAFGRALLPITAWGIPFGGILIGALVGAIVQTHLLDPLLGTTSKKDEKSKKPKQPALNPFQAATT